MWISAIRTRSDWAKAREVLNRKKNQDSNRLLTGAAQNCLHMSGWLKKKSHSKYFGLQPRFVKLEGSSLRYFKEDDSTRSDTSENKELGCASLLTVEFVRPYEVSEDCTTFEVKDHDRVFVFQAESSYEMKRWIDAIESVRSALQGKVEEERQQKLVDETPLRIRWFEDNIHEFTKNIKEDLMDMYEP